jgi:(2R)-3-sulfolactate dehydrogenase (NADP+)
MHDAQSDLKLSVDDAIVWVANIFEGQGASAENAASVARALLGAEADGLKGHGLSRIPSYLAMLKSGKAKGTAVPRSERPRPGILAVDAGFGFAYPAIDLALAELPPIAREQGIAVASIRCSNHCGAAGLHVETLAKQGLVALFFANAPASIAPWGGKRPVFGTNPIAFAAPMAGREPVVVDLSVSKVARGNIMAAKQRGDNIPEGWALDPDGNPTTDAAKGLAGTMLPMGDAKGAALAFMVEALSACLVGAALAQESSSFFDGVGEPPGTGQLIIAIDPAGFGHGLFDERMATLAAAIEDQPGARLSGARRLAERAKTRAVGVVVPAGLREQIAAAQR